MRDSDIDEQGSVKAMREAFTELCNGLVDALATQTSLSIDGSARLRSILKDATEHLGHSFSQLEQVLVSQGSPSAEHLDPSEVPIEEIRRCVGEAVTALQFDDIATQLLSELECRLQLLQQLGEVLRPLVDGSITNSAAGTLSRSYQDTLITAVKQMNSTMRQLTETNSARVTQSSLDEGSTELF